MSKKKTVEELREENDKIELKEGEIRCKVCHKPFIPTRNGHICCSRTCRDKLTKYKKEKTCEYCGRVFHSYDAAKFCSEECKHNYKIESLQVHDKICPICKKSFKGFSFQIYCSIQCKSIQTRENHKEEAICEWCEETYTRNEYIRNYYNNKGLEHHDFCSHSCCIAYMFETGKIMPEHSSQHEKINVLLDSMRIEYTNEIQVGIYRLDIYLENRNKAIEIMGTYWHGDSRRFSLNDLNENQQNCIEKDKRKRDYIEEQGIKILYLWEKDIDGNLDLCKRLINLFINNNLEVLHSSHYDLLNYDDLIELNTKQYMEQ